VHPKGRRLPPRELCLRFRKAARPFEPARAVLAGLVDVGPDRSGAEHGHADPIRREIIADAFRKRDHRGLARCVDRHERWHPDQTGERCRVDHMTSLAVRSDTWHECLDTVHDTAEIDAETKIPIVVCRSAQRPLDTDARVVDNHVYFTEALLRLIRSARHGSPVAHIERNAVHSALRAAFGKASERRVEVILAQIADGDAHPGLEERLYDAEADAARASGHEGYLVAKVLHPGILLRYSSAANR